MTSHTSTESSESRPLRQDAERNRERIIRAAQAVFAAKGLRAGLNDIAHHAGVGVGTVYRRFPTKPDLVAAALGEQAEQMLLVAEEATRAARAWDGLVLLLDRGMAVIAADVGLGTDVVGAPSTEATAAHFLPYVERLVAGAQEEGSVRPDVTVEDVIVLICAVSEFTRHCGDIRPDAWRRYLHLFADGLRTRPDDEVPAIDADVGPLPPALSGPDADAIARRWILG